MTILSSRVILPLQCTNALLFKCYFDLKNIIINSKANKYQQNYKQTI